MFVVCSQTGGRNSVSIVSTSPVKELVYHNFWFSLVVLFGVFALKNGPESWAGFVGFSNPIVMLINIVTLIATVFHTATWFKLAPKAVNIVVKDENYHKSLSFVVLWGLTIVVTVVILAVALIVLTRRK